MAYLRNEAVDTLLRSYRAYYNITIYKDTVTEEERMMTEEAEQYSLFDPEAREKRPNPIYKNSFTDLPLVARGEYYESAQQYILHKKAEVWSANNEEFIYLFSVEHLTAELYRQIEAFCQENGLAQAHIGKGHMYTYITPMIICESAEPEALKLLKKCRIYKNFLFSIHGWMEFHTAAYITGEDRMVTNSRGKCVEKTMKKVFGTR